MQNKLESRSSWLTEEGKEEGTMEEEEEVELSKVGIMKALLQRDHHASSQEDHSEVIRFT